MDKKFNRIDLVITWHLSEEKNNCHGVLMTVRINEGTWLVDITMVVISWTGGVNNKGKIKSRFRKHVFQFKLAALTSLLKRVLNHNEYKHGFNTAKHVFHEKSEDIHVQSRWILFSKFDFPMFALTITSTALGNCYFSRCKTKGAVMVKQNCYVTRNLDQYVVSCSFPVKFIYKYKTNFGYLVT